MGTMLKNDMLLAGADSWEKREYDSSYMKLYTPYAGETLRVYLMSNPFAATEEDYPTWGGFRIISAFGPVLDRNGNGYEPEVMLPSHLKKFPIVDFEEFETPDGVTMRRAITDPLRKRMGASSNDRKMAEKWGRDPDEARPSVDEMSVFNVIYVSGKLSKDEQYNPRSGKHILLTLKPRYYRVLWQMLENARDNDPTFDPTGRCYDLTLLGEGADRYLEVKVAKDHGEIVPPMDRDEMPEPVNVSNMMDSIRADVEAFVGSLDGVEDAVFNVESVLGGEVVDEFEKSVAAAAPAQESGSKWDRTPPIKIQKMLLEAGVEVPAGTKKDGLIALAIEHLS